MPPLATQKAMDHLDVVSEVDDYLNRVDDMESQREAERSNQLKYLLIHFSEKGQWNPVANDLNSRICGSGVPPDSGNGLADHMKMLGIRGNCQDKGLR